MIKLITLFLVSMIVIGCIPEQKKEQGSFTPTDSIFFGHWRSDSDYQVQSFSSGARVHFIFMLNEKQTASCYQGIKSKKCFCENTNTDISKCFQKKSADKLIYTCGHFGDMEFTKQTEWPVECTLRQ
ncbi:MAG: hypothetical protein HQM14_11585 [SAR324 cluster bacterium]|nr:hypothetical protein [SAR324 cluster bacterium]